jgi:hypothetical protein
MDQQKPWDLLTWGSSFPGFRLKVASHILGETCGYEFLHVLGSRTYCWVMEPGAVWQLQRQRIGSIELQVVLPILPVVSCFSICRFRKAFDFSWLWDLPGTFSGSLIFLFQGSWSMLGYKNSLLSCPDSRQWVLLEGKSRCWTSTGNLTGFCLFSLFFWFFFSWFPWEEMWRRRKKWAMREGEVAAPLGQIWSDFIACLQVHRHDLWFSSGIPWRINDQSVLMRIYLPGLGRSKLSWCFWRQSSNAG